MLASPRGVVLDTDVASFLFNRDPARAPRYAAHIRGVSAILPFIVVGEMLYGAGNRGWGESRCERLRRFLRACAIQDTCFGISELWAELRAAAGKAGTVIERQDAWVAATAVYLDLPLVTHNARHYAAVPRLQVITLPDNPST